MAGLKGGQLVYGEVELEQDGHETSVEEKGEEEALDERRRMKPEGEAVGGQDGLRLLSGVSLEKLHPTTTMCQ